MPSSSWTGRRNSGSRSPDRSRRNREETDRPRNSVRNNDESRYRDRDVDQARERDRYRRQSRSRSPRNHRRSRSRSPKQRPQSISPDRDRGQDKENHKLKKGRSRSRSVASQDSDSDDHGRHKRKKDKHRKRSSRSRDRKERKREKKDKKKKKSAAASSQWGKHGIISDADFYTKAQEFRTWLLEERKINPEAISKDQEKKEFSKFVEDFNTATLPHEKYYHMEVYERRMSALRSGEYLPPAEDSYDPAMDLKAHSSKHKKTSVEQESYLSKEQLLALRKVQHERIEAGKMKLLGMDVKQNMGVRMDGTAFD